MTVSTPAQVSTNAPALSLARLVGLRSPNSAKTIPFKNVLDAFETPDDENVPDSGEQKANSQGTTSKKALPDTTPEPFRAPQHSTTQYVAPPQSAPAIPFPNQRPAKLAAELARPTEETAETQQNGPAPETSTTPRAFALPSGEAIEQHHTGFNLTGSTQRLQVKGATLPISVSAKAFSTARFAVGDQGSTRAANSLDERSQAPTPQVRTSVLPPQAPVLRVQTPAPPIQVPTAPVQSSVLKVRAPAPPAEAVSISKPGRAVTPVITDSEDNPRAVRTPETAMMPSQPEFARLDSPKAVAVPQPQARAANPPVGSKLQIVTEVTPHVTPGPIAIASTAATTVPAQIEPTRKSSPERAEVQRHPAAVQTEKTTTARQSAPVTTPVAPAPTASAITESAAAPVAQAPTPKSKPTDSRREMSPEAAPSSSARTQDQSDAPKQTAQNTDHSVLQTVTNVAPVPLQATTSAASDIPEPPVAPQGKTGEMAVAPAPATRIATTSENFSFAARMIEPDITPVHALPTPTKSPLTPVEPQVTQPKAVIPLTKPPASESQRPQSEPSSNSSNSKHVTQSTPPAEKPDTRAPKAADASQPEQTMGPVTRWSEVGAPQLTEAVYGRSAPELAEASHTGPTLAAQEAHLAAQELPKTSTSSEILLHLTGNDQSGAAIRVADRGGSVSVSVHASDPVLRESLRSNLGELSNQLGQQGWKAELLKPAVLAAQSDGQQDSHAGGQPSQQQQQHSSGGERQSQRDRRTPGGIWQQELEQQISSGDAHAGGNG